MTPKPIEVRVVVSTAIHFRDFSLTFHENYSDYFSIYVMPDCIQRIEYFSRVMY